MFCMSNDSSHEEVSPAGPDITRREWLMRLGGTAVLMGFRGTPAAGTNGPAGATADRLPPGLYDPSLDHMTHALENDGRFFHAPAGSETDFLRLPSGPFEPQYFSPPDFALVKRLVALVLGESDEGGEMASTMEEISEWIDLEVYNSAAVRQAALNLSPEHRALAIAYYGEHEVTALETDDPRKIWREGLEWISRESSRRWGKAFLETPPAAQAELLNSVSDGAGEEDAGKRLLELLKSQVARGFYTSQRGLKELDYKGNAFYAERPGCTRRG
jgi:hypothetical protein